MQTQSSIYRLTFLSFLFLSAAHLSAQLLPHTNPTNKGQWMLQDDFSDEFDGMALDAEKWHVQGTGNEYYNNWPGRAPSQFIPEAATVEGGHLLITSKWDLGYNFLNQQNGNFWYGWGDPGKTFRVPITTGAVISKKFIQNCYMEIRCKVGDSPMSGAFWSVDASNSGEIDVFEHVGRTWDPNRDNADLPEIMHASIHSWKLNRPRAEPNRVWTQYHKLDFNITEGFHVYAADWSEDYIKFYVDGRLVRTLTKQEAREIIFGETDAWVIDSPMRIWMDSEMFSSIGNFNLLTAAMFQDAVFDIDYIRVWKRGENGEDNPDGHSANLVKNGSFGTNLNNWDITGTATREDVSGWTFWKDDNPSTDNFTMQGGKVALKQVVLKP
jgi:beta-glucanase (GH16 family)